MPAETMISCEALTERFGHFTTVDQVSFAVAKGSIFGFLGPNGAGKSTVIRMICGLGEPGDGGFADGSNSPQTVRVEVQTEDRVTSRAEAGLGPWAI